MCIPPLVERRNAQVVKALSARPSGALSPHVLRLRRDCADHLSRRSADSAAAFRLPHAHVPAGGQQVQRRYELPACGCDCAFGSGCAGAASARLSRVCRSGVGLSLLRLSRHCRESRFRTVSHLGSAGRCFGREKRVLCAAGSPALRARGRTGAGCGASAAGGGSGRAGAGAWAGPGRGGRRAEVRRCPRAGGPAEVSAGTRRGGQEGRALRPPSVRGGRAGAALSACRLSRSSAARPGTGGGGAAPSRLPRRFGAAPSWVAGEELLPGSGRRGSGGFAARRPPRAPGWAPPGGPRSSGASSAGSAAPCARWCFTCEKMPS